VYDYYRVRYREILPPRRPIRPLHSTVGIPPDPPWPLRLLRGTSGFLMLVGLVSGIAASRMPMDVLPIGLGVAVFTTPRRIRRLTVLARVIDPSGAPASLATQRPENVTFYERLGFRVSSEETIGTGPHAFTNWIMLREA